MRGYRLQLASRITFQLVAVAKIQDYFSKHKTVIKFCPNNSSIN